MIRWGILGAGKIAKIFAEELKFFNNTSLCFIASSDPARAKAFANEYKVARYGNYEDLLNSPEVEAVYIALPHSLHHQFIIESINHGKHVLCEKPITVNEKQMLEVIQAHSKTNTFLMEAMWSLFLPAVQTAKSWLDEGLIGRIKNIDIQFAFPAPALPPARLYTPELAGGSLLDIGIYPITICNYFMGALSDNYQVTALKAQTGVDHTVSIQMTYEDAVANLYCSFKHRGINQATLYGDHGYIVLPAFWKAKQCLAFDNDGNQIRSYIDSNIYHGFYYEIEHTISCIQQGLQESTLLPLSRSREIIRFMDEVRQGIKVRYPFE